MACLTVGEVVSGPGVNSQGSPVGLEAEGGWSLSISDSSGLVFMGVTNFQLRLREPLLCHYEAVSIVLVSRLIPGPASNEVVYFFFLHR